MTEITSKRHLRPAEIVGVLVAAAAAIWFLSPTFRAAPPAEVKDLPASAKNACFEFVKRQLHDPDSATLDDATVRSTETKAGEFSVTEIVRAKNGFNATRAMTASCSLSYETTTDRWTLIRLSTDDK